jgi:hypothetical protein
MPSARTRETVPYSRTTLGPPATSDHEPSPSHRPRSSARLFPSGWDQIRSGMRLV